MPSLPDLQRRFAASLLGEGDPPSAGLAVYRNAMFANYRNAMGATYGVVRALTGASFFNAAVDAFVLVQPSGGGDLNVYGGEFGAFLDAYQYAQDLPYLPDVARLEWALDEAHRAADAMTTAEQVLAALAAIAPDRVPGARFALDPSCRPMRSAHPVLRIWQVHQPGVGDEPTVDFAAGGDLLLVRRERGEVVIERVPAGEFAWLATLAAGADLAGALDAALAADPAFDLGAALRARIGNGTLVGVGAHA